LSSSVRGLNSPHREPFPYIQNFRAQKKFSEHGAFSPHPQNLYVENSNGVISQKGSLSDPALSLERLPGDKKRA